jgi:hypothetical protein
VYFSTCSQNTLVGGNGQLHNLVAFTMGIAPYLRTNRRVARPWNHSGFGDIKDNFLKALPEIQIC